MAPGAHAPLVPPPWLELADIVQELLQYETIAAASLAKATSKDIYSAFMDTPPPPKVVLRRPELPWATIWSRLWGPSLVREEANVAFQLLHNILPLRGRLARFGVEAAGHCQHCPDSAEDAINAFTGCVRTADV